MSCCGVEAGPRPAAAATFFTAATTTATATAPSTGSDHHLAQGPMAEEAANPDRIDLVRRSLEAWNRGDVDEWLSFVSLDLVYRPVPYFTDSQECRGLDAMRRWMTEWFDAWADDFTNRAESIREYGDAVIVLLRFTGHAKASGVELVGRPLSGLRVPRRADRLDGGLHRPCRSPQSCRVEG
jgi:ketosteroid isomerase-like protein